MNLQALGEAVRCLRKMRNMGVADLAEKTQISANTIYLLEPGKSKNITLGTSKMIADSLGVTLEQLIRTTE